LSSEDTLRSQHARRIPPPSRLVGGGLVIESRWPTCVLAAMTFGMLSLIFAPIDAWPLAYVCLVPWLVAVTSARRTGWTYLASYLLGVAYWLLGIHWLYDVTPPGYVALALYLAVYFPLIAWLVRHMVSRRRGSVALVLPFLWVGTEWLRSVGLTGFPWFYLSHSQHRVLTMIQISDLAGAYGVSFVIAAVNGWIVDMLIQPILVWRNQAIRRPRRIPVATLFTAILVVFTLVYGRIRLSGGTLQPGPKTAVCQQDYPCLVSGGDSNTPPEMLAEYVKLSIQAGSEQPDLIVWPETASVATLNQEFLSPKTLADLMMEDPNDLQRMRIYIGQRHLRTLPTVQSLRHLTGGDEKQADELRTVLARWYVAQGIPRSWAEKVAQSDPHRRWRIGLFFHEWDFGHAVNKILSALATGRYSDMAEPLDVIDRMWGSDMRDTIGLSQLSPRAPAWLVVGGYGLEFNPNPPPPRAKLDRYNSAYVYDPSGRQIQPRYDKVHCVLFGEYVPFRYGRLHWFYVWLNSITPWGASGFEYSLTAGQDLRVYEMKARSQADRPYRFAVPICYEDTTPEICRGFVHGPDGNKRVDFLLNISNDGWFNHGYELPQHLVGSVFRAVEHRVGVARAVNTGISGFVDPLGRVHDCVTSGERLFGSGIVGSKVATIWTDTRHSLYTRWGDWFAHACTVLLTLMSVDALVAKALLVFRRRKPTPTDTAEDR